MRKVAISLPHRGANLLAAASAHVGVLDIDGVIYWLQFIKRCHERDPVP